MDQTKDIYVGGLVGLSGRVCGHKSLYAHLAEYGGTDHLCPDASLADIDTAVAAARTRQSIPGPGQVLLPARRADVMDALLAELNSRADELAAVISTEKRYAVCATRLGGYGLDVLRYYAGWTRCFEPESRVDGM